MKLIHHSKISETKCPTHEGMCRGEACAVFRWYGFYNYKKVYFKPKFKWTDYLNPLNWVSNKLEDKQFKEWTPPELEGWQFDQKYTTWDDIYYAGYLQVNENRKWYCGLQGEH